MNRLLLVTSLTGCGHTVSTAENGQIALDCTDVQLFDLIVMDVNMPVLDGLAATRRIRDGAGPNSDTPIVMLSASIRAEDQQVGLAAGADIYTAKPVDFAGFVVIVARAAHGREALKQAA